MVNSIGSVKMAVMARYLSAGRLSQTITEEAGRPKLVSQYIHKQLCEADEANLLDEKDMHVFDLKPMTDPLYLVRCNACKRPVKASQYAAHAELCRSLMSTEEFLSECNGDAGPKKPPKMERKRSKAAGKQVPPIVAQEHYETVDSSGAAAFRSHPMGQDGPMSSLIVDIKDGPRCANLSSRHGNDFTSTNAKTTAAATTHPSKRPKLLAADMVQSSDGIVTGRDVRNVSSDVPAPLATKTYYSQRSNRLRAALSYMYHHEGSARHCSNGASPKVSEGNFKAWEVTSPRIISYSDEQAQEKSNTHTLPPPQIPNQTAGELSGVFSGQMRGFEPVNSLLNQFISNDQDALTAQKPSLEMRTSMYSSTPCPRTANSGAPLATVEQPDGIVPVV